MSDGQSAQSVITALTTEVLTTADGHLADPDRLTAQLDHARPDSNRLAHLPDADDIRAAC